MDEVKLYTTPWGYQCQGCEEWYPYFHGHSCAGAADGLPPARLDLDQSMYRVAKALERIAAALEILGVIDESSV